MDKKLAQTPPVNARNLLLPYGLSLAVAMAIIQSVIALTRGQISLLPIALTALVGIGIAFWLWRNRRPLSRVRFGSAIAHTLAFVAITTSFNAHAMLRTVVLAAGPDGFTTAAHELLTTQWFGATLVMSSAWGLGLFFHLIGAVISRGWEE